MWNAGPKPRVGSWRVLSTRNITIQGFFFFGYQRFLWRKLGRGCGRISAAVSGESDLSSSSSSGRAESSAMDDNSGGSGGDKKGDGDAGSSTADWELLSMSMTASVSDLKSALEPPEENENGSVSEATMHSQYFGQVMAHVLPPQTASGEIFAQDGGGGEQGVQQTDPGKLDAADSAVVDASGPAEGLKCEIEQQILVSSLSSAAPVSKEGEAASGFFTGVGVVDSKENEGIVVAEAAVKQPRKDHSKARSMKRQLQLVVKKVSKSSTVWSIALVATVTGLIIIGRRYYDSLANLDLDLDACVNEEKISEVTREITPEPVPASAPDATEAQSTSSKLLSSLRDLW